MDHEIRRGIITKLIHAPRLFFNELWGKRGESNAFAYHLKRLEDEGIVGRFDDGYGLTREGRKLSTSIEGDTGGTVRFPMCGAVILARRGDRILAQQRLKQPYRGVWGLVAGKIPFGWDPDDRAKRDFFEETGLECGDLRLRAIEYMTSVEDGKVVHHHIQFLHETWDPKGALIERTHKGKNAWLTPKEYHSSDRFPGEWLFDVALSTDDFVVVRTRLEMEDGRIVDHTEKIIERYTHGIE